MDPIKEELDRIEGEIARLKREYDNFFQGTRRAEPAEERRATEGMIRRMGQRRIVNTSDQFRFNNLQGRFYAFVNLWMRMIKELEEGRLTRDGRGAVVRPGGAEVRPPESDPIERVLEEFRQARRECGLPADDADIASVRRTLREKARELAGQTGKSVDFRVSVEEGKPRVKAVLR